MQSAHDSVDVRFRQGRKSTPVSRSQVRERIVSFLEHYADLPLVNEAFLAATTPPSSFPKKVLRHTSPGSRVS